VWGSGTSFVDVTERVNGVLGEPEIDYEVRPDWLKCDPSVGWKKALVTVFDWNGARCTLVTAEGQRFGVREMKDFLDRKK
jgi:hypothetical protein